jgi:aminoglycoside phosphotransferase family enzyme/predicted kinase
MLVQDQRATMAFLANPESHGGNGPVEVVETHISAVFLTGARAYKLKKAVHLPYADFSTPQIRLAACEKELTLNRATTPELYLGVRRITRGLDGLEFDGDGELVDAVVEMVRFDQASLFDRLAKRGVLTAACLDELAEEIVAAHAGAAVIHAESGTENVRGVLDINRAGFGESRVFDPDEIDRIDGAFRAALDRHATLLDDRAAAGAVRRCHGDLHLRNICLFEGRPRLFDCIDFNDQLATVDVLYDFAFLAMDLWHRGMKAQANQLTNRYLDLAGQEDGFALMPLFTALRAAVRAHVTATRAEGEKGEEAVRARASARAYYDLALEILSPRTPQLVAIGGLSGSGKSTLAAALAPTLGAPPGARRLESDRIRKAMFGVGASTRLPEEAYTDAVSDAVYGQIVDRAQSLVQAGCAVVADATFDRAGRRNAIATSAGSAPFQGVWLEADPAVLRQRLTSRNGGASDADAAVLEAQLSRDPGDIGWLRLTTDDPLPRTLAAVIAALGGEEGEGGDGPESL